MVRQEYSLEFQFLQTVYNHQPPNLFSMDIEFIELEHRENVLKLMEICGIDMKEAYQLYANSNYNFEAALNRKFNPAPDPPQQPLEPYPHHYQQPFIPPEDHDFGPGGYAGDPYFDEDLEMTEYRKFKQSGRTFEKQYPNRNSEGFIKSFFKFVKGNQQISFKKDLQKYLQRHTNLKVEHNNLSDAFHWCWKEKFPLAVILLDFSGNNQAAVRKLFSDDLLIEKVISEQFKAFGINCKTYELEPELKPFFDLQRDANTIVLCRVNHLDNIQIVRRISINESLQDIKKKIKQAKSQCIQNQLDQSHIVRQFQEEMRGNFNYSRPKTIKESIKMREDKKLRKQQEEEYFKACQSKKEKQPIQQRPPERKVQQKKYSQPQYQPQIQPKRQSKPVSAPSLSIQKVNQMRAERLSRQKKYSAGIMFKVRVPQGNNLIVQVDGDEPVQYLFDFVENQPEELGFSNQLERKFDLCVGFGSGETLKGKEKMKLKQLFQGSQVLIVREL